MEIRVTGIDPESSKRCVMADRIGDHKVIDWQHFNKWRVLSNQEANKVA